MTPEGLRAALGSPSGRWPERDWAMFDIREQGEAHAGHIPTATFLPRRLIEIRIRELVPDCATRIVIYDSGTHIALGTDNRAELACEALRSCGYPNVTVLEGGFSAWAASGGPVSKGSNVLSKAFGEKVLAEDQVPTIKPEDLEVALHAELAPVVCDVRTEGEYRHHHLPGAVSTPGFDLVGHLPEFEKRGPFLVINCAGRTRSIIATATARKLGCSDVRGLENGTMGWQIAGLSVTKDNSVAPPPVKHAAIVRRADDLADAVGVEHASITDLAEAIETNASPYIFDLRSLTEFTEGHIPGAIAVPGGQLIQRTDDFVAVPAHRIVIIDNGCGQAPLAGYWLKRMGFPRVSRLVQGHPGWAQAGLPLQSGRRAEFADTAQHDPRIVGRQSEEMVLSNIEESHCILDVRTSREFAAAHIAGARWAPRGWLEHAADPLLGHRTPVLVARDQRQALLAGAQLIELGFPRVEFVADGMAGWRAADGPVASGLDMATPYAPDLVEPPYAKGTDEMKAYIEWEIALHHSIDQ